MNVPKGKKPPLSIDSSPSFQRRKPSTTSIGSAHPLRQTSFPPPERAVASPRGPSYSPAVKDESVVSSAGPSSITKISGVGRKGKGRRKKRDASRGATAGPSTVANDRGESAAPEKEEEEPEEEDEGQGTADTVLEGGLHMTEAEKRREAENLSMLLLRFSPDQMQRYEMWKRAALKKDTVRRLVNQTLSQSVPQSIIIAVRAFVKVFIGELIEEARIVQTEWLAASPSLPNGEPNPAYPGNKSVPDDRRPGASQTNGAPGGTQAEETRLPDAMQVDSETQETMAGSGITLEDARPDVRECDRGPLTPDHLREAYRRYKRDQKGGNAGLLGISLQGKQTVAARTGGRRRLAL